MRNEDGFNEHIDINSTENLHFQQSQGSDNTLYKANTISGNDVNQIGLFPTKINKHITTANYQSRETF